MGAELALVAGMGLLGSAHCIGMCGGFAVLAHGGAARGMKGTAAWLVGKTLTYVILGAAAGLVGQAAGAWSTTWPTAWPTAQTALTVALGIALVLMGLATAGVIPDRVPGIAAAGRLLSRTMGRVVSRPGATGPFALGVVNGLLPCGLLYGAVAAAATTGSISEGAVVMAVFGAATIPSLTATAWVAGRVGPAVMRRIARGGGWLVVILGLMTLWRAWMTATHVGPMQHG